MMLGGFKESGNENQHLIQNVDATQSCDKSYYHSARFFFCGVLILSGMLMAMMYSHLLDELQIIKSSVVSSSSSMRLDSRSSLSSKTSSVRNLDHELKPQSPAKILIVYVALPNEKNVSDDPMKVMAQHIATGAREMTSEIRTLDVQRAVFEDVVWADAIILGSPVINANVHPAMVQWQAMWDFQTDLSEKIGSAFVVAGGMSAGEETTLMNIIQSMLVFRLIIVGGSHWTFPFGASAIVHEGPFASKEESNPLYFPPTCYQNPSIDAGINQLFLDRAYGLGQRVASTAASFASN